MKRAENLEKAFNSNKFSEDEQAAYAYESMTTKANQDNLKKKELFRKLLAIREEDKE